jgi:hypothetical protein
MTAQDIADGLYWGKNSADTVRLSMDGGTFTAGETLTFSGFVGNVATWTGTSVIPRVSLPAIPVETRFTVTLGGAIGNFESPLLQGFPATADAVAPIGGNYTANWLFEARPVGNLTWTPALDLYDATAFTPAGNIVPSNFGGSFYVVPEPAGLALLGVAAAAVGMRRRRAA